MDQHLFPKLSQLVEKLPFKDIPESRQTILNQIANYLKGQLAKGEALNLVFICTHNSRRSVLAQVWAMVMAIHFEVPEVHTYSAGTEATAVYPMIIETLQQAGIEVKKGDETTNTVYQIKLGEALAPISAFSKTWQHPVNPSSDFAAIMVCSDAEDNCPFIPGCSIRIGLPYQDPKSSEGTHLQREVYWQRNLEIASEMKFIFSNL